eukprot:8034923-Prorocentrum_lima.AAC.1
MLAQGLARDVRYNNSPYVPIGGKPPLSFEDGAEQPHDNPESGTPPKGYQTCAIRARIGLHA